MGPGSELEDLGPVLVHLSRTVNNGVEVRISALGDLAGLMAGFPGRGRLILQGDQFPEEDIGFVRRFLANNPHWGLVLVGKDAGTRPARVILGMERTRWLALPPDLDQMRELVRYPSVPEPPSWERKEEESELSPPPPPGGIPAVSELPAQPTVPAPAAPLSQIPPPAQFSPAPPPPPEPLTSPVPAPPQSMNTPPVPTSPDLEPSPADSVEPEFALAPEPLSTTPPTDPLPIPAMPTGPATPPGAGLDPGEMRAQVAALADIAQRLELSLESSDSPPPGLGAPDAELARLRRFTHMLGHVTSPPARGEEEFDLGDLLEEKLAAVALSTPRELRFLPKGEPGLRVLADRDAVATALEAVIDLARACAQPNGVVKAPYRHSGEGQCELVLDFPAGPLADADPARALRPGGVQQELPDLGPADLPAAAALVGAQGGSLTIETGGDLRLRVLVRLPALAD